MGVSEFVMIALVGLALFGGFFKVEFRGILDRSRGPELKDGDKKQLDD